jgi:hypothetical protein
MEDLAMQRFHGRGVRGLDSVPSSPFFEGRFGRMFRKLPVFVPDRKFLRELADGMRETAAGPDPTGDNPGIPAGYTYVGQILDHDITFDPTSSLQRANDPEGLVNFRTPRLDLDSLYGSGPADEPFMYDQESPDGTKLLIGRVHEDDGTFTDEHDLPRNSQDRALIGDPRNDENTFISQLQLAFIKFHNRVVDQVAATGLRHDELMKEAQRVVRWHWQWMVAHDFLRRTIGDAMLGKLLKREGDAEKVNLDFYRPKNKAFMPVEFSVAAFRFGHSQVRGGYKINNTVPGLPTFLPDANPPRRADFRGFRGLPPQWSISWPFFFPLDEDPGPTPSRKIDTKLVGALFGLPGENPDNADDRSLARRNLLRGLALQLPSGQAVAKAMGVDPLSDDQLALPQSGPAPLWFYVLKEAEVLAGGAHLGPVGGRIVGETILGLIKHDPLSYLSVQPGWRPDLGSTPGAFDMADLLRFAVPDQVTRF